MSLVDEVNLDDEEDLLPPRKQRPDPPASKKQQEAEAVAPPVAPAEHRERPAKRAPLPRGTVLLGGAAVAGTLLAVVGAAGGAVAVVATAAGVVLVPAAWFTRNARSNRRGGSRRGGSGRQRGNRRGGLASWLPGGLGGGGRHGAGSGRAGIGRTGGRSGAGGSGRRGSGLAGSGLGGSGRRASGARSGGLPGLGGASGRSRRAGAGGGVGAGSGRGRSGAGRLAGLGGRRRAGTGAGWGRHGIKGRPVGKLGARGAAKGVTGRGKHGVTGQGTKAGARAGTPIGRGVRGIGRGLGKGARAANQGAYGLGAAATKGYGKPTGRRAFAKAYRQYGKKKNPATATGYAKKVMGGAVAGMSAGTIRFLANRAIKMWKKMTGQRPPAAAQALQNPASQPQPVPKQKKGNSTQHPVPNPAFAPIAQTQAEVDPSYAEKAAKALGVDVETSTATTVVAGVAGPNTAGVTPMSSIFPPYNAAVDFHSACMKFQPIGPNGKPSIWPLHDALPLLKSSIYMMVNGYIGFVANCQTTLEGGLHPVMREAMAELWNGLAKASSTAENLEPAFTRAYADAIARSQTRGRQAENV